MMLLLMAAGALYGYWLWWLFAGLRRLDAQRPANTIQHPYSVIIAAHNEEPNLARVLGSLVAQNYPPTLMEIIVVADRCEDDTAAVARTFQREKVSLHLVEIETVAPGIPPKKNALQAGLARASFHRFLMLDADITLSHNFLATVNKQFEAGVCASVGLAVPHPRDSFWQRFLGFEKMISWCVAGSAIGWGSPILAYGSNWGYTREALEAVGGFRDIMQSLSGDDDLLVQKFGQLPGQRVTMCLNPDGWVYTDMPGNLSSFIRQRRRHFSAGKYYPPAVQLGYGLYHAANLLLWILWIFYPPAIWGLLLKLAGDFVLIRRAGVLFYQRCSLPDFFFFNGLFVLYNSLVGPLGHIGKIRW
ncbi:MAG TPA: glycosyltransferase [Calditrichia bacterium]|nr:glycosyltransferase [Calditrichota bacterium]HQV32671.1 glycosyltransferase [Calditrichia bacterium]